MSSCPFPGMDPFIEAEEWQDFHLSLTAEIKRALVPQLPDHYQLTAELIVKDRDDAEERAGDRSYRPDVGITLTDPATLTPPTRQYAAPVARQRHLLLRDRRNQRLVTAIEVLSPSDKGSNLGQHLQRLHTYWYSRVTTIDIDLLRRGSNPYPVGTSEYDEVWPERTYQVVTTEPNRRMSLWAIGLTEKLPTIPVPLSYPDPPAVLDLQRAFTELYTYSTYRRRTAEELSKLRPPLTAVEEKELGSYLQQPSKH